MKPQSDIYTEVTEKIIAEMEKGALPWQCSWNQGLSMPLRSNGLAYRGINILILWMIAMKRGYNNPTWMTFKQAQELGANVKKGEKSTRIVYANSSKYEKQNESTGETTEITIPFLKSYAVFNCDQIENLPEKFTQATPATFQNADERRHSLDSFFEATHAIIRHEGSQPCYSLLRDDIRLPKFTDFKSGEDYYSTLAHEIVHWTGHPSRLHRDMKSHQNSREDYAKEELIAELGASFLCATLNITNEVRQDHASYIQSWLRALKNDKKFIFQAARQASRAVDYLIEITSPERIDGKEEPIAA